MSKRPQVSLLQGSPRNFYSGYYILNYLVQLLLGSTIFQTTFRQNFIFSCAGTTHRLTLVFPFMRCHSDKAYPWWRTYFPCKISPRYRTSWSRSPTVRTVGSEQKLILIKFELATVNIFPLTKPIMRLTAHKSVSTVCSQIIPTYCSRKL